MSKKALKLHVCESLLYLIMNKKEIRISQMVDDLKPSISFCKITGIRDNFLAQRKAVRHLSNSDLSCIVE